MEELSVSPPTLEDLFVELVRPTEAERRGRVRALALALRQIRYENTAFWRNPVAAFFTFVFPLLFLVIFNLLFGNNEIQLPKAGRRTRPPSTFRASVAHCRWSTPATTMLPSACAFPGSRECSSASAARRCPAGHSCSAGSPTRHSCRSCWSAIVTGAGRVVLRRRCPFQHPARLPGDTSLGGGHFLCALGLATTAVIPNAEASPVVVNGLTLPLLFISDVFIPLRERALRGSLPSRTFSR